MDFPQGNHPAQDDSKMNQEFYWRLRERTAALTSISEAELSTAVALSLFCLGCVKEDLSL